MTSNNQSIQTIRTIQIKWRAPQIGWIKLNIDGAFENLKCGLGGVFRDNIGKWILGFQKFCHGLFPLRIELHALQEGLQLAHRFDLFPLEIETYSTELINTINNGHVILANRIHSCRSLMRQKKGLLLPHNFRQGNAITDALAKEAKIKKTNNIFQGKQNCLLHRLFVWNKC